MRPVARAAGGGAQLGQGAVPQIQVLLGLLVAVAALVTLARRINQPYPVVLVVGGLLLGLIPGLPRVELAPELVFLLFLPPLLYWESLTFSFRDLRAQIVSISLLAVGLVLATTCLVALIAHAAIARLGWASAFTLGAIVSPTDAVAASAIFARLGVPRRITTVVEGESLVNDASGLLLYRVAVGAAVSGGFSLWQVGAQFVLVNAGGVAIGLAVGWGIAWIRRRLSDPQVEVTVSLLSGFAAYLPADRLGCSGVLAVVAMGLYLGRQGPRIVSSRVRLQTQDVYSMVVFLLNGLIFILIGLQLHRVFDTLSGRPTAALIGDGLLVSAVVIVVRMAWIFPGAWLSWVVDSRRREQPFPPLKSLIVVGWAGTSGVVSLAAALALPLTTDSGAPFPQRDLLIFLAFSVILVTLLLKGLTLPALIARLGLEDDGLAEQEETKARLRAARAATARLEAIRSEGWAPPEKLEHLQEQYDARERRLAARCRDEGDGELEATFSGYERLQRELIDAQRNEIVRLRDVGAIGDEVLVRLQRELDLEEVRLA